MRFRWGIWISRLVGGGLGGGGRGSLFKGGLGEYATMETYELKSKSKRVSQVGQNFASNHASTNQGEAGSNEEASGQSSWWRVKDC